MSGCADPPLASIAQPARAETCSERRVFPPAAALYLTQEKNIWLLSPGATAGSEGAHGGGRVALCALCAGWAQHGDVTHTVRPAAERGRAGQGRLQGSWCWLWDRAAQQQACSLPSSHPAQVSSEK